MTAARAASLSAPILYAPGTTLNLNVTFPDSYALSGKWFTFEIRKSLTGSVLFSLDEADSELSVSTQTASIAVNPDSDGGVLFDSLTKQDSTLHFSADFGDDTDTDLVEYRVQGDITVLPEQGAFIETGVITSTTVSFETSDVTVTFTAQGLATSDINTLAKINAIVTDATLVDSGALGTAAAEDVGTGAGNVVQLNGSSELPAVSGANLINLPSGGGANLGDNSDVDGVLFSDGTSLSKATAAQIKAAADLEAGDDLAITNIDASGDIRASVIYMGTASASSTGFRTGKGCLLAPSGNPNGTLRLTNSAENSFVMLQMGGGTTSFPGIKRVGSGVAVRLADDSAAASISCRSIELAGEAVGNATLVGGTITVANTTVTASTRIILTRKTAGGTTGELTYTQSAGVSFTINSSTVSDTSVITYLLIEEA